MCNSTAEIDHNGKSVRRRRGVRFPLLQRAKAGASTASFVD